MERYLAIIALRILILRSSAENGAAYRGVPLMRMVLQTIFVAVLGLVLLSCAGDPQPVGEQQTAQQTPPCEGDERFRESDFWLGDWEVSTAQGPVVGTNRIEKRERGCVLLERWTPWFDGYYERKERERIVG